jgi:hypothetical protein
MHGIHHAVVHEETDSNWSSGLTLWDWLHGTLKLNVPQQEITIGLPAYRDPGEVTLPKARRSVPSSTRSRSGNRNLGKWIREPFRLPGAVNECRKKRRILLALENASA